MSVHCRHRMTQTLKPAFVVVVLLSLPVAAVVTAQREPALEPDARVQQQLGARLRAMREWERFDYSCKVSLLRSRRWAGVMARGVGQQVLATPTDAALGVAVVVREGSAQRDLADVELFDLATGDSLCAGRVELPRASADEREDVRVAVDALVRAVR
jgi:hypothetical protein